jgi:hypothetical protein
VGKQAEEQRREKKEEGERMAGSDGRASAGYHGVCIVDSARYTRVGSCMYVVFGTA